MTDKPDDRLKPPKSQTTGKPKKGQPGEPKIFAIVDGQKFVKPGLETYFVDPDVMKNPKAKEGCVCDPVVGTYCSCNKVAVCSCVGHTCSCVGHRSSSGRAGCRCAPVH